LNITHLKEKIINNEEYIIKILQAIGCCKIHNSSNNEIRCAKDENSNSTGISIKKDTLYTFLRSSTMNVSGDIFTLIQELKDCKLYKAIEIVCNAIGLSVSEFEKDEKIILPFGGYYTGIKREPETYVNIPVYSESVLTEFKLIPHKRFLADGINLKTQQLFNIGYDEETDRIIVPWRNSIGQIVGITGRYNDTAEYCKINNIPKWFPIINFYKSQILFGFYENYNYIQSEKTIFIGESEKFPMQLRSMEIKEKPVYDENGDLQEYETINCGVSVGGHSISNIQKRLIQSAFLENIIVCFDEGIPEEQIKTEAEKLKYSSKFIECNIAYVFDRDNKYLPKDSKASPSDFGKDIFQKLIQECTVWI
jgi:DNA primase